MAKLEFIKLWAGGEIIANGNRFASSGAVWTDSRGGMYVGSGSIPCFAIERKNIFMVRAVNGVFQAHYYQTEKKTYTIKNQTDRPRIVFIEHPIRAEWSLSSETVKPEIKTDEEYRFRINLAPHASLESAILNLEKQ